MPSSANDKIGSENEGSGATTKSVGAPGPKRFFSPADKVRIITAANAASRGELGALLRREGVYSSQLAKWRRLFSAGGEDAFAGVRRGPKQKVDARDRRILELERKNARLEGKLSLAHKLLDLQKKVSSIFGIELPTDEANS